MAVYLDHAATTPLRPEALAAMLPFLTEHFGNPSGSHAVARRAKEAIEDAREEVAAALGCLPREVVFTGGGTEADNLAIAGALRAAGAGSRAVCSAIEHHAVLHPVESRGGSLIEVDREGVVDLEHLRSLLRPTGPSAAAGDVAVVSVMLANNEIGVVQPLDDVVEVVREEATGALVHTDAVHAFPWLDVAELAAACDLVSVSAHKFGGPKGVGALVVREGTRIEALVEGGGQERELRSGTHNVAAIVGMAAAATATVAARAVEVERVRVLRDRLVDAVLANVDGVVEVSPRRCRVAGNAHLLVAGVESESVLALLDDAGVCASAGSSCASGAMEPSHVLAAAGVAPELAAGAIRFSLGVTTTDDDVDIAVKQLVDTVARLRSS
ncbi:MAG TPA: cysteine desulfurase family protein [Acidimicrobiales bacterium]|nr:cysteine desulfurase family protein [Acidimicrobiales bacterium]